MSEEIIKKVNIKKKKTNRPIYYGVAENTGELIAVNDVERGLACGCICPSCGTCLEARKGQKKKHHFAHKTNKDCLYGAEVSIYRAFYELLKTSKRFFLPDAVLKFNSNKEDELVREGTLISLSSIEFHDDPVNYPPELLCYTGTNCFRVILNIESYYEETDYQSLKEYGRQNDIAVVNIDLNDLDSLSSFTELQQYIDTPEHKSWVFNRIVEEWNQRYQKLAIEPAVFECGHLCLAQKNQYKNVYSARIVDCIYCQYCYDYAAKEFCIAPSYIDHIEDFQKPELERKLQFIAANNIKPIKKISDYRCPKCGAPMMRKTGPNGVFAGCSKYPQCKGSRKVEQTTEQVIVYDSHKWF